LDRNDDIEAIQIESMGIPGEARPVTVDDVVIRHANGRRRYVQAKKCQTGHRAWSLGDQVLKEELVNARDQLEADPSGTVMFYSPTSWGDLPVLVEACSKHPDYTVFAATAPQNQKTLLERLSAILKRSPNATFALARRLEFGPLHPLDEWHRHNSRELGRLVTRPATAKAVLERHLATHQAKLREASSGRVAEAWIRRDEVIRHLREHGHFLTPGYEVALLLEEFSRVSQMGRQWPRQIEDLRFPFPQLPTVLAAIGDGKRTILLRDAPGAGKTCFLLDLADEVEQRPDCALLFIKGDLYPAAATLTDLVAHGLPVDLISKCASLAEQRKLVVILDSLDVLAMARSYAALKLFLGLLDQLAEVPNTTLVAACRSFDCDHDPLLRGRKWDARFDLNPLDYERDIVPLLRDRWHLDPATLPPTLPALLIRPRNLALFARLAKGGYHTGLRSEYDFCARFIDDIIRADPLLGSDAFAYLGTLAQRMLSARSTHLPATAVVVRDELLQRLLSQQVLQQPKPGSLGFVHQSLGDAFIVHHALANGQTLQSFIGAHAPLPSLRPALRAFFFHLRAVSNRDFRRQVGTVMLAASVPYHLRRLLAESLAEIEPSDDDWPLLRRLFDEAPELFDRMVWSLRGDDAWWPVLTAHWLPLVHASAQREKWLGVFLYLLRHWAKCRPAEVVAIWLRAFDEKWLAPDLVFTPVWRSLGQLEDWSQPQVRRLLEHCVMHDNDEHGLMGTPLSRWVAATNQGDDLLWRWMTARVQPGEMWQFGDGQSLRSAPHHFEPEDFLSRRMVQSGELITLALDAIERWSSAGGPQPDAGLTSIFLHSTSWDHRHSQRGSGYVDIAAALLLAIENALRRHASEDSAWWRAHEQRWRTSRELAIRYLLLEAYSANVPANLAGIATQVLDQELLATTLLSYELASVLNLAMPHFGEGMQERVQDTILGLNTEEEEEKSSPEPWRLRARARLLRAIPCCLRTPAAQALVEAQYGDAASRWREPEIHAWGGVVVAAVTGKELPLLSDETILRLARHYCRPGWHSESFQDRLVGGMQSQISAFRDAASRAPLRFLRLLPRLRYEAVPTDYLDAMVDGAALFLAVRTGHTRLSDSSWKPVEPADAPAMVATELLAAVERFIACVEPRTCANALESCGFVLRDSESLDHLAILLLPLTRASDPDQEGETGQQRHYSSTGLNSTRGKAASAAALLAVACLETGQELPYFLQLALQHVAQDPVFGVRTSLARHLPYLTQLSPALGWDLFDRMTVAIPSDGWEEVEPQLYHYYYKHYPRVQPCLAHIWTAARTESGETWGRITALCVLAGHAALDRLLAQLAEAPEPCWESAVNVFAHNLDSSVSGQLCRTALLAMLGQASLPPKASSKAMYVFSYESAQLHVDRELAEALLRARRGRGPGDLFHFARWVAGFARRAPLEALPLLELATEDMAETDRGIHWHGGDLAQALNLVLQEADERDDPALIARVVALQDRWLSAGYQPLQQLLDKCSRPD
jgi:hypothetical protein